MKAGRVPAADHDAPLVNVMKLRCRSLGLEVQTAHAALFARALIYKGPPGVIPLDAAVPAGNGPAVCEMLATDPRSSSIPALILTGKSDEETLGRCRALNARYLLKAADLRDRLKARICDRRAIQSTESKVLGRGCPGNLVARLERIALPS